jgi:hypothetical protein
MRQYSGAFAQILNGEVYRPLSRSLDCTNQFTTSRRALSILRTTRGGRDAPRRCNRTKRDDAN